MENKKSLFRVNYLFIVAALFCVLLLMLSTVSCKNSGNDNEDSQKDTSNEENTVPNVDDDRIIWHNRDASAIAEWNGLSVSEDLIAAFENAKSTDLFAVNAFLKDVQSIETLTYEGRTYASYRTESDELRLHRFKLLELQKEANDLIDYPNGYYNGYPKEFYEQRIDYYGEELINQYIVDGVFLEDKINEDVQLIENRIRLNRQIISDLRVDYIKNIPEQIAEEFKRYGYNATVYGERALLIITKEEFYKLNISNPEKYFFRHAPPDNYDSSQPLPD